MSSKYWIKLYHEILDDPKMGMLPDNLWRRTIELFLMAGELSVDMPEDDRGHLPPSKELAWRLRQSVSDLEQDLEQLAEINILTKTDSGWRVTHFAERQKAVPASERMRQMRGRKQKTSQPVTNDKDIVTRSVTFRNIESDIESESKEDEKEIALYDPRWSLIWKLWTNNIHLAESPLVVEEMQQEKYLTCPFEWWQQAATIASRNRVFTWTYVRSILDRSIETKESPDVLGPPKGKDKDKARSPQPESPSPLPPSPDLPPPAPIPKWAELWEKAAGLLRGQMTQATYEQVISHLEARPNHNGTFILAAPSGTCEQVRRLDKRILIALQQFKPEIKGIEVITQ